MRRLGIRHAPPVSLEGTATPGGRCPACGAPLFPRFEVGAGEGEGVVDRCEGCGLLLLRGPGRERAEALIDGLAAELGEGGEASVQLANASSLQAMLGQESWAGLRAGEDGYWLTPPGLEALAGGRGLRVESIRFRPAAGMAAMWQTILDLLTFNRDFGRRALRGRLRPRGWRGRAAVAVDALVTVLAAVPAAAIAVLCEAGATAIGRGGVITATLRPSDPRPD